MNTCAEVGYRQGRKKGGGGGRKWGGGKRGEGRSVAAQQQQRGLTYRDLYSPAHPPPHPPQPPLSLFPANLMTTSSSGETSLSLPWQLNVNQERERAAGRAEGRLDASRQGGGA